VLEGSSGDDEREEDWEPVRLDIPVDAYIPADYVPYEVAKIDIHRRIAATREPEQLAILADELEDRFGEPPEPVENLMKLQEARIKLGRAGARTVEFRAGRLVVAPVSLELEQTRELREEVPEAVYESLKKTLRIPVPEDPAERFGAVLQAADALLRARSAVPSAA
jgi:transcription-repair coupling factor (superfamily II helicase)